MTKNVMSLVDKKLKKSEKKDKSQDKKDMKKEIKLHHLGEKKKGKGKMKGMKY